MATKPNRTRRPYPQSEGNVAAADERLGVLHAPKAKPRAPQLRVVRDRTEEDEREALAPTIGILNGIRLSLTLWGLIILVIYWIRVSL